jgi:hypothetical protein
MLFGLCFRIFPKITFSRNERKRQRNILLDKMSKDRAIDRAYRLQRLKALHKAQDESREEFLRVMNEDSDKWMHSPAELSWRRMNIPSDFVLEGSFIRFTNLHPNFKKGRN